jgi:hypothetical protein
VHNFSNREKITFVILQVVPNVKHCWETLCEKKDIDGFTLFAVSPTWGSLRDAIKEQYYHVGIYDDCIQYGPHYDRKETKQCQSSLMFSIPYAPIWV